MAWSQAKIPFRENPNVPSILALLLLINSPAILAEDTWEVPICGAPNKVEPGYVPHGDPRAKGTARITRKDGLLTVEINLGNQRYDAHHAHLYSVSSGYTSGNVDVGHSTICWAYDNTTSNNGGTAPYNEKSLSITDWPQPGAYAEDWYKDYINDIPADGGDWYVMVHMLGGHFATDKDGHLIPWDSDKHEVRGDENVKGNWGGSNKIETDCNARVGRRLNDKSVKTGTCVGNTVGKFDEVDEFFLDMKGVAWLDQNGNLTPEAIAHGYDLETEYLFYNFADEGIAAQYGGPEGGAGGWLNPNRQDKSRCANWPPADWGKAHPHVPNLADATPPEPDNNTDDNTDDNTENNADNNTGNNTGNNTNNNSGSILSASRSNFSEDERIVIEYSAGTGSKRDWIGIYAAGTAPSNGASHDNYLSWAYTNGRSGTATFPAMGEGNYVALLFEDNSWNRFGNGAPAGFSVTGDSKPENKPDDSGSNGDNNANNANNDSNDDSNNNSTDTIKIRSAVYNRKKGRLWVAASSSDGAGVALTVEGFGAMTPHKKKNDRLQFMIETTEDAVPSVITVTSENGGSASRNVKFK